MHRHSLIRWLPALLIALCAALVAATGARANNIALGKAAFADVNPTTAANVTNGNFGDEWNNSASPSAPSDFIAVDLGASTPIRQVKIYWGPTGQPTGFTIDTATNVVTDPLDPNFGSGDWNTVYTRTSSDPQPAGTDAITIPGNISARYIRINGTEAGANGLWGVREFNVYDVALATLSGTIRANGNPATGAVVTLLGPIGQASQAATQVTTAAGGAYSFAGLDPGSYKLTASLPGQFAPVTVNVTVGGSNMTQDVNLTQPIINTTAILPAFTRDFVTPDGSTDADASTTTAFPAEEWPGPAGGGVWNVNSTPPSGLTVDPGLPTTLKFALGPIGTDQNNVLQAPNAIIPFAPAHYTTIYVLEAAVEGGIGTTATLNYTDGTSTAVTTPTGDATYTIPRGDVASPAPAAGEITAFSSSHMVDTSNNGTSTSSGFTVYARPISVDSSKVLANITYGPQVTSENTLSKAYIFGWSADSVDTPPAYGSISGTVKAPNGSAVSNAIVQFLNYRIVTGASGTYTFNSVPQGTWTVTASKPASYAPLPKNITLTAGQNGTLDIQFTAGINVVAAGLGSPSVDLVSSDANYPDFFATGFMPGREYYPTGIYSPDLGGNDPNGKYVVASGAPGGLTFNFVDYGDTPVAPGDPAYPPGGTPNVQLMSGGVFLAPPAKITNAYFAVVGAEGGTLVSPTLTYTDGTTETKVLAVSDWFGTPTSDELPYLIMKGRHTTGGEANVGANIRLNVLPVPVNSAKTLKQIDFYRAQNYPVYPLVFAVAWETDPGTPVPAPVNVTVHVTTSGGSPAAGAIVTLGPYNIRTDAGGNAIFRGLPVGLTLGLGAFIPGQTRQARQENFTVPSTATTVNVSLPSTAPTFVPLSIMADYDAIAMADMPGDFKTGADNDTGFIGENLPATGATVTVNGVPYLMPHKETLFNNTQRINGQTWPVIPGHYSAADIVIVGFGLGGDHPNVFPVYLNYADGTREQVTIGAHDWVQDWPNPGNSDLHLFWREINPGSSNPFYSAGRRNQSGDDALNVAFLPEVIPVNAGKVLSSIQYLPMPGQLSQQDTEILTATLEANESLSGATITGRVVGQPLGAASSGPLGGTSQPVQVWLDAAHAAYTNADGTFTIANAPTGSGTVTVTAYGSGILTKTFPVNLGPGSNNLGDFNIGQSVSQIAVVLGPNNTSNGLSQVEGSASPYGYTLTFSRTVPGTVGGQTERTTIVDSGVSDMYFRVDPGWEWRGKIGNAGLDLASLSGATPKIAPHLFMQVQYYDQGTNTVNLVYDKMETATHSTLGVKSIRITNPRATFSKTNIVKAGTNTWKTMVYDLDPASDPFGAYKGVHLETDFRFRADPTAGGFQPTVLHSVILSLSNSFTQPVTASDILRVAGGLLAAPAKPSAAFSALDVNGDGKIDLKDAAMAQRSANGH